VKAAETRFGKKPADPTTKECPFCLETIPLKAKRCKACTSDLD
jgi:large conductance mechanosensitive channel